MYHNSGVFYPLAECVIKIRGKIDNKETPFTEACNYQQGSVRLAPRDVSYAKE